MTYLIRQPFKHMASLSSSLLVASLVLAASVTLGGCGEEEKKPKKVERTKPKSTPKLVQMRTIEELKAEYKIDDRVEMPEDKAPTSEKERIALLQFFDAWVRSNPDHVLEVLGMADQAQLLTMIDEGQWGQITGDAIEFVTIQVGPSKEGDTCVLAYFEGLESNQYQLWRYRNDGEDTIIFEAVATPPGMVDRLSGEDLIAGWWKVLDDEAALWDLDDNEELDLLVEDDEEKDGSASGDDSGRRKPGGGGSGRRKPGGGRRVPGGR
ncbi:MAG: hypothetical protein VX527_11860 [Planctomycetota bacterium]|nr:hypothetical protein [Planctomycetota bacterium]